MGGGGYVVRLYIFVYKPTLSWALEGSKNYMSNILRVQMIFVLAFVKCKLKAYVLDLDSVMCMCDSKVVF